MTIPLIKKRPPEEGSFSSHRFRRPLAAISLGLSGALVGLAHAFAQNVGSATSQSGSLGDQLNKMSGEAINAGGTGFGMVCYLAAAVCFALGAWALWQSRQPQHRETGYVGRGVAGLVLCGLFATAGVWIGKSAMTASGGAATINDTPAMVNFGSGTGG